MRDADDGDAYGRRRILGGVFTACPCLHASSPGGRGVNALFHPLSLDRGI
jgi:hypothetical protein